MVKTIPRDRVVRVVFELETPDGYVSYLENDWKMFDRYDRMTMIPNLIKAIRKSGKSTFDADWEDDDGEIVDAKVRAPDAIKWLQWLRIGGDKNIKESISLLLNGAPIELVIDELLEGKALKQLKTNLVYTGKEAVKYGAKGAVGGAVIGGAIGGLISKRDRRTKKSTQIKQKLKGIAKGAAIGAKQGAIVSAGVPLYALRRRYGGF